jgi:hypothetical protein
VLDDETGLATARAPRRSRALLVTAATVPWLVAAALLLPRPSSDATRTGDGTTWPASAGPATPGGPAPSNAPRTAAAGGDAGPGGLPAAVEPAPPGTTRTGVVPQQHTVPVAAVLAAARAILTGDTPGSHWPLDLVVTGTASTSSPDVRLVSVEGTALVAVDGDWTGPVPVGVVVPVGADGALLDAGWPIAVDVRRADPDAPVTPDPVTEPAVLTDALRAAGWTVTGLAPATTPAPGLVRVRVSGTDPHGQERRDAPVWLTTTPPSVLGAPPAPRRDPTPREEPA